MAPRRPPFPMRPSAGAVRESPLPAEDAFLAAGGYDLDALAERWASAARRTPITAERMRGADRRAQGLGIAGERLMEHAGAAVAAAVRALLAETERTGKAAVLVLAGPGNNGGDGSVAARHLAAAGLRVVVVLVASETRPQTADAARNWDRLAGAEGVDRLQAGNARDVAVLGQGVERASLVVDALLGTGVRGALREPIRSAVEVCHRARRALVPVVSVDTPTALDLTSGIPSDPVVRADVTVTFHRPKEGLLTRDGRLLAGRVLVAPIGIPSEADPT
ncbi:MAG TPA: NAD(P)H-hydrate epimerase [Candidatus Limnocylindrales bacterium]|nr:NAD(P)H-hydrate epimerase [Candidatus Limnocylindrales bacterium]